MISQAGEMAEYLMTGQGYIPCPISDIIGEMRLYVFGQVYGEI
jgi:hypothetical protein